MLDLPDSPGLRLSQHCKLPISGMVIARAVNLNDVDHTFTGSDAILQITIEYRYWGVTVSYKRAL